MRFDDSLATVLAADADSGFGAQSAWRQLVDLTGRGRVPDVAAAVARLRGLRDAVPAAVRGASGRALAWGEPPAPLVRFFAEDELTIAAPVLRSATLTSNEWLAMLPALTPATRSVLRHRRDLPPEVMRGLASFGPTDFVLAHDGVEAEEPALDLPEPLATPVEEVFPIPDPAPTPFVAVGEVARALPVVAEAMRQAAEPSRFEIADIVARIDAFRRDRPEPSVAPAGPPPPPDRFDFHTDAAGVIRWVEGVARTPLIGVCLARAVTQGVVTIDAAAAAAWRTRSRFDAVAAEVGGDSSATGRWLLSGVPRFDRGRFTGMAGLGRRVQPAPATTPAADSLRQLVHELRTPANAIAGFSELIATALLGPVPPVYRDRAQLIEREAGGLVAAIEDLDTAARLESGALDLRPAPLDLAPLLAAVVAERQPLAMARRASLTLDVPAAAMTQADDRAVRLLVDRLLGVALAVAEPGERLRLHLIIKAKGVRLHVTRPRGLTVGSGDALLALDRTPPSEGGPLLGTGFTLRLVRDLAAALGGTLQIAPGRLTLRLPAAVTPEMERAAAQ